MGRFSAANHYESGMVMSASKPHSSLWATELWDYLLSTPEHIANGKCPDIGSEELRDRDCIACRAMDLLDRVEQDFTALRRERERIVESCCGQADHLAEEKADFIEQLEAMQAALTELLSWHPQLPQVREKVMHPQHQEAVERAEALVASNPTSGEPVLDTPSAGDGSASSPEDAYWDDVSKTQRTFGP